MMKSRKKTNEWAAEVVANGEVVERIWPSREAPVETVVVWVVRPQGLLLDGNSI